MILWTDMLHQNIKKCFDPFYTESFGPTMSNMTPRLQKSLPIDAYRYITTPQELFNSAQLLIFSQVILVG